SRRSTRAGSSSRARSVRGARSGSSWAWSSEVRKARGMGQVQKTILVADDESHILHVVSMKLRNAGFRVVTARDGREAFEMALHEKPDLLITDYHMPELSGLELCRKLKEEPSTTNIPAIMLTARGYQLEK